MELPSHIESKKKQWDPYDQHGGTAVGVAGSDYVMLATDTRLSSDYNIDCRYKGRIFKMTSKSIIVATGFSADIDAFVTRMQNIIITYQQEHFKELSTEALAHCVSNVLYSRRNFPYYVNIMVGGISKEGKGILYGYDPVGTIENLKYDSNGSGSQMSLPILDAAFGVMHRNTAQFKEPTIDEARNILRDAMASITERDIHTGDTLQVAIMSKDGFKIEEYPLPNH